MYAYGAPDTSIPVTIYINYGRCSEGEMDHGKTGVGKHVWFGRHSGERCSGKGSSCPSSLWCHTLEALCMLSSERRASPRVALPCFCSWETKSHHRGHLLTGRSWLSFWGTRCLPEFLNFACQTHQALHSPPKAGSSQSSPQAALL